jgi:L-histidine Nalpha-methyltransferase
LTGAMRQRPTPTAQLPRRLESARSEFAADVFRDLQRTPRQLQSRYLYDDLGSRLFEAICRLPWYRITRAEERLLDAHAGALAAAVAGTDGAGVALVELGVGSGEKLVRIIGALPDGPAPVVHLIDVSPAALDTTTARVSGLSASVHRHLGTYEDGLRAIARAGRPAARTAVLLLGSNIGNFDTSAAGALLAEVRRASASGDWLLLGADLVKPPADLLLAYDDPLGVTAAFNRNLLVRINRELDGTFDLDGFAHRAVWNAEAGRVEMHLVSRTSQAVEVRAIDLRLTFAAGDTIWTESSYKYTEAGIAELGRRARFEQTAQWVDRDARFALTLFAAV